MYLHLTLLQWVHGKTEMRRAPTSGLSQYVHGLWIEFIIIVVKYQFLAICCRSHTMTPRVDIRDNAKEYYGIMTKQFIEKSYKFIFFLQAYSSRC